MTLHAGSIEITLQNRRDKIVKSSGMTQLQLALLGPPLFELAGRKLVFATAKARALLVYLAVASALGVVFIRYAIQLRRPNAPGHLPMTVFRYSITYLMVLFAALLVDHYVNLRF